MDPATEKGLEIVEYIKLFLDHNVPLRSVTTSSEDKGFMLCVCGCVWVCRMGLVLVTSDTGDKDVSVALSRGFYHLVHKSSPRDAVRWLLELQSSGLSHLSRKYIVEMFSRAFGSKKDDPDLESVFGDAAPYEDFRKVCVCVCICVCVPVCICVCMCLCVYVCVYIVH